jgi:hypothetical protein
MPRRAQVRAGQERERPRDRLLGAQMARNVAPIGVAQVSPSATAALKSSAPDTSPDQVDLRIALPAAQSSSP